MPYHAAFRDALRRHFRHYATPDAARWSPPQRYFAAFAATLLIDDAMPPATLPLPPLAIAAAAASLLLYAYARYLRQRLMMLAIIDDAVFRRCRRYAATPLMPRLTPRCRRFMLHAAIAR